MLGEQGVRGCGACVKGAAHIEGSMSMAALTSTPNCEKCEKRREWNDALEAVVEDGEEMQKVQGVGWTSLHC